MAVTYTDNNGVKTMDGFIRQTKSVSSEGFVSFEFEIEEADDVKLIALCDDNLEPIVNNVGNIRYIGGNGNESIYEIFE